jgi:hypothetical protein
MDKEIAHTQAWIEQVVVALNFCPFAKKELISNSIHYDVCSQSGIKPTLHKLSILCSLLQENDQIATGLLILTPGFRGFDNYLDLVDRANELLYSSGYEGIFQLASFHPEYCFGGEDFDDAANYTNRSPYPMLHLIREAEMTRVLRVYEHPEQIPLNNIDLARAKGADYFQALLTHIKTQ